MFKSTYIGLTIISAFLISFVTSSLLIRIIIKLQNRHHEGQAVNKYLTQHHQNKKLTPTLGGVAIVGGIILSSFFYPQWYLNKKFLVIVFILISFFIIGLVDDLIKVKGKNYHGLSSMFRILIELIIGFAVFYILEDELNTKIQILNSYLNIGSLIIILIPLILSGTANAVNLTDGLDGLSSSLYLIAIIPFILFSIVNQQYYLTYILISSFGSTLGFICFNLYPSKIFMGDSGSLSLGSLLAISAILLDKVFILIICGGVFIFETLSVIMQVSTYKIFHKRVFLMAPFHHHLELKGKKEYQIVMYFFVIGLVLSMFAIVINFLFY